MHFTYSISFAIPLIVQTQALRALLCYKIQTYEVVYKLQRLKKLVILARCTNLKLSIPYSTSAKLFFRDPMTSKWYGNVV
jgi:hypothetical protein